MFALLFKRRQAEMLCLSFILNSLYINVYLEEYHAIAIQISKVFLLLLHGKAHKTLKQAYGY